MQNPVVMAFRARLIKLGYTSVSIHRMKKMFNCQEIYKVVAYDPLCCFRCERYMTLIDMYLWR